MCSFIYLCLMSDVMKKNHFNWGKGLGKCYILLKQFSTFNVSFYMCYLIYDSPEVKFKLNPFLGLFAFLSIGRLGVGSFPIFTFKVWRIKSLSLFKVRKKDIRKKPLSPEYLKFYTLALSKCFNKWRNVFKNTEWC